MRSNCRAVTRWVSWTRWLVHYVVLALPGQIDHTKYPANVAAAAPPPQLGRASPVTANRHLSSQAYVPSALTASSDLWRRRRSVWRFFSRVRRIALALAVIVAPVSKASSCMEDAALCTIQAAIASRNVCLRRHCEVQLSSAHAVLTSGLESPGPSYIYRSALQAAYWASLGKWWQGGHGEYKERLLAGAAAQCSLELAHHACEHCANSTRPGKHTNALMAIRQNCLRDNALLDFFLPMSSLSTVSSVHFSVFFLRWGASVRFSVAAGTHLACQDFIRISMHHCTHGADSSAIRSYSDSGALLSCLQRGSLPRMCLERVHKHDDADAQAADKPDTYLRSDLYLAARWTGLFPLLLVKRCPPRWYSLRHSPAGQRWRLA
jgi:hypothetical protein